MRACLSVSRMRNRCSMVILDGHECATSVTPRSRENDQTFSCGLIDFLSFLCSFPSFGTDPGSRPGNVRRVSFYDQTWKFSSDKVAARRLLGSGDVVILITIASEPD